MTKNRAPTPVYLDPGMHPCLEVKGLTKVAGSNHPEKMVVVVGMFCIYIKGLHLVMFFAGFRYELFCVTKSCQTPQCLVRPFIF